VRSSVINVKLLRPLSTVLMKSEEEGCLAYPPWFDGSLHRVRSIFAKSSEEPERWLLMVTLGFGIRFDFWVLCGRGLQAVVFR
jgi:hypothetical protein